MINLFAKERAVWLVGVGVSSSSFPSRNLFSFSVPSMKCLWNTCYAQVNETHTLGACTIKTQVRKEGLLERYNTELGGLRGGRNRFWPWGLGRATEGSGCPELRGPETRRDPWGGEWLHQRL